MADNYEWISIGTTTDRPVHEYVKHNQDGSITAICALVTLTKAGFWTWEVLPLPDDTDIHKGIELHLSVAMLRVEIALGVMPVARPTNIQRANKKIDPIPVDGPANMVWWWETDDELLYARVENSNLTGVLAKIYRRTPDDWRVELFIPVSPVLAWSTDNLDDARRSVFRAIWCNSRWHQIKPSDKCQAYFYGRYDEDGNLVQKDTYTYQQSDKSWLWWDRLDAGKVYHAETFQQVAHDFAAYQANKKCAIDDENGG